MEKAKEYFGKLEIPIAPRNPSLVFEKSQNENSSNLKDSMKKIRITEPIRTRDQKFHIADAILLIIFFIELIEILKVHKIAQLSSPSLMKWIEEIGGISNFHLVQHIPPEDDKDGTLNTRIRSQKIPGIFILHLLNLEAHKSCKSCF